MKILIPYEVTMKTLFSKNCVILFLFFLIATMAFATTSSASYQKTTYKRLVCPPNPFAANASSVSCPLNSGNWVWIDTVDPLTRDIFEMKIVNDGAQLINYKSKKIVASFKGAEATAFLLMAKKNIVTDDMLIQILTSTYKISQSNAKSNIVKVKKVLTNLNRLRNTHRYSMVPYQYEVYRFY